MSNELVALVGVVIGIVGTLGSALVITALSNRRRASSIRSIVYAEVIAIKEKTQRYINGQSTVEELARSSPMLVAIATEIGFLSREQVVAYRQVVTLDMEMRAPGNTEESTIEKALLVVAACDEALGQLHFS